MKVAARIEEAILGFYNNEYRKTWNAHGKKASHRKREIMKGKVQSQFRGPYVVSDFEATEGSSWALQT